MSNHPLIRGIPALHGAVAGVSVEEAECRAGRSARTLRGGLSRTVLAAYAAVAAMELPSPRVYIVVAALLRGEKITMTAIHNVVESPFFEVGANRRGNIKVQPSEYLQMRTAVERAASFWSADEYVDCAPANTQAAAGASWFAAHSQMLVRRVAAQPDPDPQAGDGPFRGALVELRGPEELGLAHRILAEAFGLDVAKVVPRCTTIAAELLHLRTWALYHDATVLACALAVQVTDVVVVCAVATQPALQGRGYGMRLMRMLHGLYERTGAVGAFLLCSSERGRALFERLGYYAIARRPGSAPSNVLVGPPQRVRAIPGQFGWARIVQAASGGG